jgi:hypothetical protein
MGVAKQADKNLPPLSVLPLEATVPPAPAIPASSWDRGGSKPPTWILPSPEQEGLVHFSTW